MMNTTRNRADHTLTSALRGPAAALFAAAIVMAAPEPAAAIDLALPGNARETARDETAPDSQRLAVAPYGVEEPSRLVEGRVTRAAWRVDVRGITTLQLLEPLRDQLTEAGFDILFECDAPACGGFDFRYTLDVIPEPDMHVDLFDYRYLSARKNADETGAEYAAILVSRSANAGFIQITLVTPPGAPESSANSSGTPAGLARPIAQDDLPLAQTLLRDGRAVLADLAFETGSSTLGDGGFASLEALASFLLADPGRRVALVGHTDAVGSLDNNIALSKRRAASVLERLVSAYDIPRKQLEAGGMGYLSPITSNLTPEGRELNRRVEAVLLNTK